MRKLMKNSTETDRKYVNILGINIDGSSEESVLAGVERKISDNVRFSILTPNPELVLLSQTDKKLKDALNSADFAVPDGVGLAYASRFLYDKFLNIIPGRILFEKLIELSAKKGYKVFFLGGLSNEVELAKLKIENSLKISSRKLVIDTAGGPEVTPNLPKSIVNKINKFSPDLLFVAFGNPKQEIFVWEYLPKLKVKGIMAVGGTFRYVSGLSPFPPKWMSEAGLEWLWRLFTEPKRIKRIWNAVVVFPWKVFNQKFKLNF